MKEIILLFLCFFLGIAGAWTLIRLGEQIGMTDLPNERSSHNKKVCKGGGIGLLFAIMIASFFLKITHFLWLPALGISLASLWGGDRYKLTVKQRLFVHFGCGIYFLLFLSETIKIGGGFYLLSIPMALLFIVGTSNFYNFMDGIDGIAGITALVGFLLLANYGIRIHAAPNYITFCVCICASCIGFLFFNFPRAKVFLGDVGSILIGFVFSCLTIVLANSAMDFLIMAGFIFPFYIDEISTMVIRIKDRESLIIAHRRHLYQLLVNEMGTPHWIVSVGYGIFQAIVGLSLMTVKPLGVSAILSTYCIYSMLFIAISLLVRSKAHAYK
ncbi:UDP-N-acetylmuramyl pentapeptide phosphotransferase [Desulfobacter sp.]|uniref:UDP-N-acetylmuramyl pentapeptide phosphotransferase n=1 Tax=Desulfobacter sp. TaxID=2294 RepID=UPI000E80896E|nr:UDP-N-acetylmuramyl pentapeptide phosphotransferase [Desulfobacter sp.]MBP8829577.1 UDP-N-acetylmuramyl pentapeptide phosphotransferase [Desulfobacter sp.]HBT88824.1 UDP-N-acetylmuramyl pentapeptide phosphotransferase [Desulfobacter sp.]